MGALVLVVNRRIYCCAHLCPVCFESGGVMALYSRGCAQRACGVGEEDPDGTRWLVTGQANLPHTVVSRSLAVPATAKRNAMGRQLDPAAFVVSHGWVPEMVMLVLDDPEDPTPYWLVASKHPEQLLAAFLPEQQSDADQAAVTTRNA